MKNRVRVALSMANPPQVHCTTAVPIYGKADDRLVITVAPQNDICPHGRTYPRKAVAMSASRSIVPVYHVFLSIKDP